MTTTHPSPAPSTPPRRPAPALLVLAAAAAAAAAVDLIVLGVARSAGADMVVRVSGAAPHPVDAADVAAAASVVPMLAGTVLAVLLGLAARSRAALVLRLAQVIGGGLGVLSALGPLTSESSPGTRAALAVMHAVVGLAVVAGLEPLRRRAAQRQAREW